MELDKSKVILGIVIVIIIMILVSLNKGGDFIKVESSEPAMNDLPESGVEVVTSNKDEYKYYKFVIKNLNQLSVDSNNNIDIDVFFTETKEFIIEESGGSIHELVYQQLEENNYNSIIYLLDENGRVIKATQIDDENYEYDFLTE